MSEMTELLLIAGLNPDRLGLTDEIKTRMGWEILAPTVSSARMVKQAVIDNEIGSATMIIDRPTRKIRVWVTAKK